MTPKRGNNSFASAQFKALVERVERVQEEKDALSSDMREIYAEAKGQGFDTKVMRRVIRERRIEKVVREENEALFDLYWAALGMDK